MPCKFICYKMHLINTQHCTNIARRQGQSHWPDDGQNPSNTKTVTFSNNKGWSNVYIHYWGGSSSTTWPGAQMTNIGVNDYGETQFTFDIPADTTGIVFHDNNGSQTVDINYDSSVTGYYLTTQSNGKWEVATWT